MHWIPAFQVHSYSVQHFPLGWQARMSKHFAETMRDVAIDSDESLVSFDVTSLLPIGEAVDVIRDRLREENTTDRIAELLSLCLKSTHFSYGGEFYERGLPMDLRSWPTCHGIF